MGGTHVFGGTCEDCGQDLEAFWVEWTQDEVIRCDVGDSPDLSTSSTTEGLFLPLLICTNLFACRAAVASESAAHIGLTLEAEVRALVLDVV